MTSETTQPLRIALLGSTGSVGRQALAVARENPSRVRVVAVAAHRNVELLAAQAHEFGVKFVGVGDEKLRDHPSCAQFPSCATPVFGAAAIETLCTLDDVDLVLNALVGAVGLRASYATLQSGRQLALANKESLVIGGDLLMPLAGGSEDTACGNRMGGNPAYGNLAGDTSTCSNLAGDTSAYGNPHRLLPVDSEHSAIFQCLVGENRKEARRIWLTASGGPFRGRTRAQLEQVTAAEALAHPTWLMGPKISIDSATLMNKGLEVIEAHHLFAMEYDNIRVLVHPQSIVHSMVEYCDGSVKAHLGIPDMRIPIQYALSWPRRWPTSLEPLDFTKLASLEFGTADTETFGALRLAFAAGMAGGTAPVALNAANEVAVHAFLEGACSFLDIERVVETVLEHHDPAPVSSIEHIEAVDAQARREAQLCLTSP
jgi:1-deoxy-D-xylulose-5-phosphate reductoisomerase